MKTTGLDRLETLLREHRASTADNADDRSRQAAEAREAFGAALEAVKAKLAASAIKVAETVPGQMKSAGGAVALNSQAFRLMAGEGAIVQIGFMADQVARFEYLRLGECLDASETPFASAGEAWFIDRLTDGVEIALRPIAAAKGGGQ